MKLYDINWHDFLTRAAVWDRLSTESRRAFLRLKGNAKTGQSSFGDEFSLLVKHQFLKGNQDNRTCRVDESCRGFSRAIRAMSRCRLFATSADRTIMEYLAEHFTREQLEGFCPAHVSYYLADSYTAQLVSSIGWVEGFLAARDMAAWEKKRLSRPRYAVPLFGGPEAASVVRKLVEHFVANPQPVPFTQLSRLFPETPLDSLAAAIPATIRYVLLFPGMDDGHTPMLGLWPAVAQRLNRPQPQPPASVRPDVEFHAARAMEDLTTLLVAAAGQPLRLRAGDGRLFARVHKELGSRLLALPDWIPADIVTKGTEQRLYKSQLLAIEMDLADIDHGRDQSFQINAQGERWLAESPKQRLKAIVAHSKQFSREFFATDYGYARPLVRESDVLRALETVYRSLTEHGFVQLADFLSWHLELSNPYAERAAKGQHVRLRSSASYLEPTLEQMERQWRNDLIDFLRYVMLPMGGVKIGYVQRPERLCIALTEIGRFLLGLRDDFDYGPEHAEAGEAVVQPNFEIVFLSASPLAEVTLARLAERKGSGLGALFKLTKPAIFEAAGTGITCEQALETLRQISTKELPDNVVREIKGWFGQCRKVGLRTTILVRCPDADTAARVVSAGGRQAKLLTDTIVELPDAKAKQKIIQKLKKVGVFVERASPGKDRGGTASYS